MQRLFQTVKQSLHGFILKAVAENAGALVYASPELHADEGFMWKAVAVAKNAEALAYASADLRANRGFMSKAVAENVRALAYVSDI